MRRLNPVIALIICCLGFGFVALVASGCSDDAAQTSDPDASDARDATAQPDAAQAQDTNEDPDVAVEPDVATQPDVTSNPDATEDVDAANNPDAIDPGCSPDQTACDETCVDTNEDAAHCGDCDTACGDGLACVDGECELRPCGGRSGDTCGADEYCEFPEGTVCDYNDGTGHCAPRPTVCPADEAAVCGCDGTTYAGACEAQKTGTDVASPGACGGGPGPGLCDGQDVSSTGDCDAAFGPFWTGDSCEYLSGCSCEGNDCDKAYESIQTCQAAHRSCFNDCRNFGCPNANERCGLCWTDYLCIEDGTAC